MVSFDVTSLYTNIPIIDTLNITKDYVHNDDQFARKTAIPQDKFLDLVNLVSTTTWYTFNSQFYQQMMALQWEAQHPQPQQKFICRLMKVLQYLRHCILLKFGNDLLMTFTLLLNVCNWKTFHHIHHFNNLHQNIKFTMEEESNGELAFLDTLLKRNNGEISILVYRKPTHIDQYLHYSSHHQTSCKESVVSSLFNRAYSIITNKDDLHKENPRIKQVLKENGYQESIISKIFKRITNNHSLPRCSNKCKPQMSKRKRSK